ncbi:MAG: hypothetical protein A3K67_01515 [Euryarchaeota archaeon RBG_16_62_10]|nr:MAG: hypothetical protein A3K67_01515 [Euryarchaeota archaeon RBG_16_62_10]
MLDPAEVGKKLRRDYSFGHKEQIDRALEAVLNVLEKARTVRSSNSELLREAAKAIYHEFHIREVAIGLLDLDDGLYKYVAMYGMRPEVWGAHSNLTYTYDDFYDPARWKGTVISNYSKLLLAEDMPYTNGEEKTYDKQLMRKSRRRTETDSIEGDYMDIHIYGPDHALLGWIEVSGTWDAKIPDARTVRWLEVVASVIGLAVTSDSKAIKPGADKNSKARKS